MWVAQVNQFAKLGRCVIQVMKEQTFWSRNACFQYDFQFNTHTHNTGLEMVQWKAGALIATNGLIGGFMRTELF